MNAPINPYKSDSGIHVSEILISPSLLRILVALFLTGLLVPAGLHIITGKKVQELGQETSHRIQYQLFSRGNRKVHVGKDGWLYYRPGLDSLTGYGPLKSEADSVSKDPNVAKWREPLPVIIHFAGQLRERGIDLMLVPVPDKSAIQPEGIISGDSQIRVHPDREKVFAKLESNGIEMIDLLPLFEEEKKAGREVFLKQDTHWRPEAMSLAAGHVAGILRKKNLYTSEKVVFSDEPIYRTHIGDLVGMLGLSHQSLLQPESVRLSQNPHLKGTAPVVVLGDSFVNIFDDPSLGFGKDGESRIGAGFTAILGANLGYKIQNFAINGDGATAARQAFASQPDNIIRSKKQVVWLIAERDLFMSRSTGHAAGVLWRDVEFSKETKGITDKAVVITARLREKSRIRPPQEVNYPDAIFSAKFDSIKVISGDFVKKDSAILYLWAFRKKKLLPTAHIKEGVVYHLTLLPLLSHPEAKSIKQLDDFFDREAPFFIEKIEAVP